MSEGRNGSYKCIRVGAQLGFVQAHVRYDIDDGADVVTSLLYPRVWLFDQALPGGGE